VVTLFAGLWLFDGPRYVLLKLGCCLFDLICSGWQCLWGHNDAQYDYCPSVCAVISCWNEAEGIEATLRSLWGSYPRLQIIVVDDGSTDETSSVVRRFVRTHEGDVVLLWRARRGGKSSAMNLALQYTKADVILTVDADSHVGPNAVWEIVQPLANPRCGAVSGLVVARNGFTNLATCLQAFEYLNSILVGRTLSARLCILGIASGAFAAFPRDLLLPFYGWDVGPGEDADITLKIRKAGYQIAFARHAECFTDVPASWRGLFKQRLRWDRSILRFKCRKHCDMAYFWYANFRMSNLFHILDVWYSCIARTFGSWAFLAWLCLVHPPHFWHILVAVYLAYVSFGLIHALTVLFYSNRPLHDGCVCLIAAPLNPAYQLFLRAVRTIALVDEFLFRGSYKDDYVPEHIRVVTFKW